MKVLFLNPPFKTEHGKYSRTSRTPAITKSGTVYYPIWLCYAAAAVEQGGHEIKVIDSCANQYNLEVTLNMVNEFKPDIVIEDTSTASIHEDVRTAEEIKKIFPNTLICLMGTHPSSLPEETLRLSEGVDCVAVGEADLTCLDIANKFKNISENYDDAMSSINGLVFRDSSDKIITNKARELNPDLDSLPFVSEIYSRYLNIDEYFFAACDYPEVQIMTSRGCVARCTYCVYPYAMHGLKYRKRSAENIADEFEWIANNLPSVREIGLEDDTFTGDQKHVVNFCKIILERGIKIKWYCNVRANLKKEVMVWMKKAGCVLMTVGYESASSDVLLNIDKKISADQNLSFSKNAKEVGIMVHGCFMAGNRGDTKYSLKKNLELALEMMDDTMQFFPLTVYPGTPDYDWAHENNVLLSDNYSDYVTEEGMHNSLVRMKDMSVEEILSWCDESRKKYYLRPKYLFYKLKQSILHPQEIRRNFKAGRRFIKILLSN
jgi:anaerobic magnesium-protoporphyrin IX monomethyl ester cyclase